MKKSTKTIALWLVLGTLALSSTGCGSVTVKVGDKEFSITSEKEAEVETEKEEETEAEETTEKIEIETQEVERPTAERKIDAKAGDSNSVSEASIGGASEVTNVSSETTFTGGGLSMTLTGNEASKLDYWGMTQSSDTATMSVLAIADVSDDGTSVGVDGYKGSIVVIGVEPITQGGKESIKYTDPKVMHENMASSLIASYQNAGQTVTNTTTGSFAGVDDTVWYVTNIFVDGTYNGEAASIQLDFMTSIDGERITLALLNNPSDGGYTVGMGMIKDNLRMIQLGEPTTSGENGALPEDVAKFMAQPLAVAASNVDLGSAPSEGASLGADSGSISNIVTTDNGFSFGVVSGIEPEAEAYHDIYISDEYISYEAEYDSTEEAGFDGPLPGVNISVQYLTADKVASVPEYAQVTFEDLCAKAQGVVDASSGINGMQWVIEDTTSASGARVKMYMGQGDWIQMLVVLQGQSGSVATYQLTCHDETHPAIQTLITELLGVLDVA